MTELKNDKERLKGIREIVGDENLKVIDENDTFGFKCQQCGKCCINRDDIILNPFDVYNAAKYLNISPKEFVADYTHCSFGSNSKMPMLLLKTSSNGFCPLLKYDILNGGVFKCLIQEAKPGACSNHPIGVIWNFNSKTKEKNVSYIKTTQCENSVSDEMHVVKDWVKPYTDNIDSIDLAHKIQFRIHEHFDPAEFHFAGSFANYLIKSGMMGECPEDMSKMFYNKNNELDILQGYLMTAIGLIYTNFDIDKSFTEQEDDILKTLDEFYEQTNKLFKTLRNIVEEISGKELKEIMKKYDEFKEGIENVIDECISNI